MNSTVQSVLKSVRLNNENASAFIFHEVRIHVNGKTERINTHCTSQEEAANMLQDRIVRLLDKGFDLKACAGIGPGMTGWHKGYKVSVWVEIQRNKKVLVNPVTGQHDGPELTPAQQDTFRQIETPSLVAVEDGTYTVTNGVTHRTVRIKTCKSGTFAGKRIAELLIGQDNENDYNGFAFVDAHGFKMWKKYTVNGKVNENWQSLINAILNDPSEAGKLYALRSGKCCKCNRTLTTPESIAAGIGPECAKKYSH